MYQYFTSAYLQFGDLVVVIGHHLFIGKGLSIPIVYFKPAVELEHVQQLPEQVPLLVALDQTRHATPVGDKGSTVIR